MIIVLLVLLLLGIFAAGAVLKGGDAGMFKYGTQFDRELSSCSSCSQPHVLILGDPDINGCGRLRVVQLTLYLERRVDALPEEEL